MRSLHYGATARVVERTPKSETRSLSGMAIPRQRESRTLVYEDVFADPFNRRALL